MNDATINRILDAIGQLGNKLEGGASRAFEVAVRQAFITGIVSAVFGVVLICLSLFLVRKIIKTFREDDGINYGNESLAAALGIFSFISAAVGIPLFATSISKILNPQWHAIEMIFGRFM